MTRNGLIALLVVVITGAVAIALQQGRGKDEGGGALTDDVTFPVSRGDLNITITENGTLVAKDSQGVKSEIRGNSKIEWLIEEGAQVEEGDVVCRLDVTQFQTELEETELSVLSAKADLETAETNLEIQHTDNKAEAEKAQTTLEKARNELDRYTQGDAPKTRRSLEIAIKNAETDYAKKEKYFQDSIKLQAEGFITETQLEEDELGFETAGVQLEGARIDLEMNDKYTHPMTLTDKQTAVTDAIRSIETSGKRAQTQIRQKEVAVEERKKRLERYEKRLKERKEQIEKSELKAPCPGIVIYGDPKQPWFGMEIKVGGDIWGEVTVITIPDLRVMQVKLSVHEADIIKVKEGQPVKVTMDTYPGLVLDAKVSKIASIAGGGFDGSTEIKKFAVEITMDDTQGVELKPGISAKAEIFIEKKQDVLFVPIQCVFMEEGQHFCYVAVDGTPTERSVVPGSNNDSHIEILEGLEEGERVLLYNPNLPTAEEEKEGGKSGNGMAPPAPGAGAPPADG